MNDASKQDNIDLGKLSPRYKGASPFEWVTASRYRKEGLVSSRGLSRDPEGRLRQPERLRDHILNLGAKGTQAWKGIK